MFGSNFGKTIDYNLVTTCVFGMSLNGKIQMLIIAKYELKCPKHNLGFQHVRAGFVSCESYNIINLTATLAAIDDLVHNQPDMDIIVRCWTVGRSKC